MLPVTETRPPAVECDEAVAASGFGGAPKTLGGPLAVE
jgi:hypothetical protein